MASRFAEAWELFQARPGEESFEPLYETTKALVYTICYRILRNREDAGDALQNTFARLLVLARDPSSQESMPDVQSVIRRLAVLEADSLRNRRGRCAKREILMHTPPDRPGADLPPDRIAAAHELRDRIETLVSTLPERQRLPILLHFFHGMTQAEIAQALDRPVRTVSDQIAAGLKRLRPLMHRAGLGEATLVFAALIGASEWLHPPASLAAHVVFAKSLVLAQGMGAAGLGAGAGVIPAGGTGHSLIHFIHWGGITMKAKLGLSVVAAVLIAAGVFVSVQLRENPRERAARPGQTSRQDSAPGGLGTAGPSLAAEAASGTQIPQKGGGVPISSLATPSSATTAAPVAPAPPRETEGMTIQGCITDESGLPIAGAHVATEATFRTFWPDAPTSGALVATSQPDGRYTLSGIKKTTGLLSLAAFRIDASRSGDAAVALLGEKLNGTLVADDYAAYNRIAALLCQSCLAHPIRIARDLAAELERSPLQYRRTQAIAFCNDVKNLLSDACKAHTRLKSPAARFHAKASYTLQLRALCASPAACDRVETFRNRLLRTLPTLFTFLTVPGVPPTNNAAERALRTIVIFRKTSFGIRSDIGAKELAVMSSLLLSVRLQKGDPLAFTRDLVANNLHKARRAIFPDTS